MSRVRDLAGRIHPDRSALLVIDMQNDFVHPAGETARWMRQRLEASGIAVPDEPTIVEQMVPTLHRLVAEARVLDVKVVWVRMELDDATRDRFMNWEGWRPCEEGTWGAEWYGNLGPATGELTVVKRRHSAFFGTDLAQQLRALGIETVVATGTATMGCVEGTLRDAYANDFWSVIVEDCTGQMDSSAHLSAVERIDRVFGVACSSDELIETWRRVREASAL